MYILVYVFFLKFIVDTINFPLSYTLSWNFERRQRL